MKRGTVKNGVLVCLCVLGMAVTDAFAGFDFVHPEIMLEDGGSLPLNEINIDFDNDNSLHAVWTDDVVSIKQIYGSVVMRNGTVIGKFPAMIGNPTQSYGLPHIFRNGVDTSKMYEFAINRDEISPESILEGASWDLTLLPDAPGTSPLSSAQIIGAGIIDRSKFDMVSVGDSIIFAVSESPHIEIRRYSVSSDTWETPYYIYAGANNLLLYPRLAKDDSGCIYLSYNDYNDVSYDSYLLIRRTSIPDQVNFWLPDVTVESAYMTQFMAELAVEGQSIDQKTALVYTTGPSPLQIVANVALGNMWPSEGTWPGTPVVAATMPGAVSMFQGPDVAYSPGGSRLYIVWADDRESLNSEVYGVTSYDGGLSFQPVETLTDANLYVPEPPRIVAGTEPGNLAIGFIRADGAGSSPYVLVSVADFLDPCDNSPETYWDESAGVSVDYVTYFSPPASYRLANDKLKGTLLQDYGTLEQTGYVSLYFYDDPAITGTDFLVGLENTNSKGVIRMLGVRNESTTTNYVYSFDGENWVDSGFSRQLGWHRIVMDVNAVTGLAMSLEYSPGSTATWTDPTFTSFTSITIEGGEDADPYFVDDIQVLAVPLVIAPLPATTPVGLLIALGIVGVILFLRRR